jgi:hypothetical protein
VIQFTSLGSLLQSFLCSANEALAIQDDAIWRLKSGTAISPIQQRRFIESWDRLQWEIQRQQYLYQSNKGRPCIAAARLMERYVIKLERFREAAYLGHADDQNIAAVLYEECLASGQGALREPS